MQGENYTKGKGTISDVSWRDMFAQDPYYGLSNSFQYSENINCDDEMHGIKLSQKILSIDNCANCQLISAGDKIFALPLSGGAIKTITFTKNNNSETGTRSVDTVSGSNIHASIKPAGVIFQDSLWIAIYTDDLSFTGLYKYPVTTVGTVEAYVPYDHVEDTDESIADESTKTLPMTAGAGVIMNYNNTRLVVGVQNELRVYYPELDLTNPNCQLRPAGTSASDFHKGYTGWKKVQDFEGGSVIVGLTCTFEYLKVRVQDEGRNTKVFYYQGNNDLRNTFVYDLIDLTGTKVLRAYNINGIDYFTASLDGTAGYITFNKIIGKTVVQLFKQRGGLTKYDINQKTAYFVGPTSIDAGYLDNSFYIADAYGVFKFKYNPEGYDTGYLKRKIRDTREITPGLCVYKNFVVVSDQEGIKMMRTYDTGIDGYESRGLLISREMEGDFGGSVAKMLDEVRCHYELNEVDDAKNNPGTIDIYVSPNNLWRHWDPEANPSGWYKVMHIDKESINTRFEISHQLNNLMGTPAFEFDWETITYCVVIKRAVDDEDEDRVAQWTPIVREVNLRYHLKGKTNYVYELNNS